MKSSYRPPLRHLKRLFILIACIALVACQQSSSSPKITDAPALVNLTEEVSIDFEVTADWNVGDGSRAYTGTLEVKNNSTDPITDWVLGFDIKGKVVSAWDADLKQDGEKIKLIHKSYNSTIAPGGTLEVGFEGRYSGASIEPRKFYLNGAKVGDHSEPTPLPNPSDEVKIAFEKTADWDMGGGKHGFTGKITFTNESNQNVDPWMVEFDFDATLTQMWDGRFEDRDGHFVVTDADWNARLKPRESFSFGFNGEYSGTFEEPSNYLVNRRPLNMATLISVAQRDPGVQLFINAARGSGHSIGWEQAMATPVDGKYILLAPIGNLAANLIISLDETRVETSVLQWTQAPGFPACDPETSNTLHLTWSEYLKVGYSLPYTDRECATHDKSDVYSVGIADSQSVPLYPVTTRLSFKRSGEIKNSQTGESQSVSNLEDLTRVKPLPNIPEREETLADVARYIKENFDDDAERFLDAIPTSKGGTGPEVKANQEEVLTCLSEWKGHCGSGGTTTKPGSGSPKDPGSEDPPNPPSSGDTGVDDVGDDTGGDSGADDGGADGSSDGSDSGGDDAGDSDGDDTGGGSSDGNGSDSGGSDTPSGPSYNPEELKRLEDDVEKWETEVSEFDELLAGFDEDLQAAEKEKADYLDEAYGHLVSGNENLVEIEDDIDDLDEDLALVNGDITGDWVGIGTGLGGLGLGCTGPGLGLTGGTACSAGFAGFASSTASLEGHNQERDGYLEERAELMSDFTQNFHDMREAEFRARNVQQAKINPLNRDIRETESKRNTAQGELDKANESLDGFKKRNGLN